MTTFLKNLRESLTPTLKQSAFHSRGVLTPEEFVSAGDELVFRCPTWSWSSGSASMRKAHLPSDKQFLITRNVPCLDRVSAVEEAMSGQGGFGMDIDDEQEGGIGGWMIDGAAGRDDDKLADEFDLVEDFAKPAAAPPAAAVSGSTSCSTGGKQDQEQEDDEYADMSDYDTSGLASDAATLSLSNNNNNNSTAVPSASSNLLSNVRTYDISLTYDKYYQTPRVYLIGYSPSGQPLDGESMFEDVMTDYVRRTVTLENHPHIQSVPGGAASISGGGGGDVCISIHPCQHGAVMKNIVSNLSKGKGKGKDGKGDDDSLAIDSYMFIFLKFVSSIIPTVNYDFTMEAKLG